MRLLSLLAVMGLYTLLLAGNAKSEDCPTDVFFVLDNSGSMAEDGVPKYFREETIPFVQDLIDGLKSDSTKLRISIIVFDGRIQRAVNLVDDEDEIADAMESLGRLGVGSGTDIAKGIDRSIEVIESNTNNAGRRVMILMTDGRNDGGVDSMANSANRVRELGVDVYAIGVQGREIDGEEIDASQLNGVGSLPTEDHVFVVDPSKLGEVRKTIERSIENADCLLRKCKTDLYLVLDNSGSMAEGGEPKYFREESIPFAESLLADLSDEAEVRVSIVVFDGRIKRAIKPTSNSEEIKEGFDSLRRLGVGSGTDIGNGINKAVDIYNNDDNRSSKQVMVVLTDGRSDPETHAGMLIAAAAARGIMDVYAIGVTGREKEGENLSQDDLDAIASPPFSEHSFLAGPDGLAAVAEKIVQNVDFGDCVILCSTDLYFVLDNSGSMAEDGEPKYFLEESIPFAKSLLNGLLEDGSVRVSFVVFDGRIKRAIKPTKNAAEIDEAFASLSRQTAGSGTNIGLGISKAMELYEDDVNESVSQVMVVLTDGRNDPETHADMLVAAASARESMEIYAVGVTGREKEGETLSKEDLNLIASEPVETHSYLSGPDALNNIADQIENEIGFLGCKAKKLCTTDLFFVLDNSGSMAEDGVPKYFFDESIPFAEELLKGVQENAQVRVSFVVFDGRIKRAIKPTMVPSEIDDAFDSLREQKVGSGTNIGLGISKSLELHEADTRQSTRQIMVILTDGRNDPETHDDMLLAASHARIAMEVYAVGVTGRENEGESLSKFELDSLSSRPTMSHSFLAGPDGLNSISKKIAADIDSKECVLFCTTDLYFVLDNSGSMAEDGIPKYFFEESIPFAEELLDGLNDNSEVRVSFVVFDGRIKRAIKPTKDQTEIDEAFESLRRQKEGSGTNIGLGMSKAMDIFNADGRKSSRQVMVVLTDGRNDPEAQSDMIAAAARARTSMDVYAIGVTGREKEGETLSKEDLDIIASRPTSTHSFLAGPEGLNAISDKIVTNVQSKECKQKKLCSTDLYLVLDNSGSMAEDGIPIYFFNESIPFAEELLDGLDDNSEVRVSFVVFDGRIKRAIRPTKDASEIDEAFASLRRQTVGSGTNIGRGVNKAIEIFETDEEKSTRQVMVILTDGRNDPETVDEMISEGSIARSLMEVYAIGVTGREKEGETLSMADLNALSSRPTSSHSFIAGPDGLTAISEHIVSNIESEECDILCSTDLYLVLDNSGSMAEGDVPKFFFDESIPFAEMLLDGLSDDAEIRVSFIVFDGRIKRAIRPTKSPFEIDDAFHSLRRQKVGSGTNIGGGINKALEFYEQDTRRSSRQVMVILTDGRNDPETMESMLVAAANARVTMDVYAIGVTGRDDDEGESLSLEDLGNIASRPTSSYTFLAESDGLQEVANKIEANIEASKCSEKLLCSTDLYFVLDNSGSMSENGMPKFFFEESIPFAEELLSDIEHDAEVRVSFVVFDGRIKRAIRPTKVPSEIDEAFASLRRQKLGAGTNIGLGINKALQLFNEDTQKSVQQVMVILTDGLNDPESYDAMLEEASLARQSMQVYAIGVTGRENEGEGISQDDLNEIASRPAAKHSFLAGPDGLTAVSEVIAANVESSDCEPELFCSTDLYLVLDNSGSMAEDGVPKYFFEESIPFAEELLDGLDDNADVRVSFVVFDGRIKRAIKPTKEPSEIDEAFASLRRQTVGSGTNIGLGISKALELYDDDSAKSTRQVMVVLTDGLNDDETFLQMLAAASDAHKTMDVYAIGVTGRELIKIEDILPIASRPEHAFVTSPEALSVITKKVEENIENSEDCNLSLCSTDLYFILDNSGSMAENGIPKFFREESIPFAKSLLDGLSDYAEIRVAFIVFDGRIQRAAKLSKNQKKIDSYFTSLENLGVGSGTNILGALEKTLSMMKLDRVKSQEQVTILLTDGLSDNGTPDQLNAVADDMRAMGSDVYVVIVKGRGIDDEINIDELVAIASKPLDTYLYIDSPDALSEIRMKIETSIEDRCQINVTEPRIFRIKSGDNCMVNHGYFVRTNPCNDGVYEEKFFWELSSEGMLKRLNDGKCMTIRGSGNGSDWNSVIMVKCSASRAPRSTFTHVGGNLVSALDGRCLRMSSLDNTVKTFECGESSTKWEFWSATEMLKNSPAQVPMTFKQGDLCLDATGFFLRAKPCADMDVQKFNFNEARSFYRASSGQCVDVQGALDKNWASVRTRACTGMWPQSFNHTEIGTLTVREDRCLIIASQSLIKARKCSDVDMADKIWEKVEHL